MYDMLRNYGEFALLGGWGILLVLMRRIVFGKLIQHLVLLPVFRLPHTDRFSVPDSF